MRGDRICDDKIHVDPRVPSRGFYAGEKPLLDRPAGPATSRRSHREARVRRADLLDCPFALALIRAHLASLVADSGIRPRSPRNLPVRGAGENQPLFAFPVQLASMEVDDVPLEADDENVDTSNRG
jgi:hypothetical protein